MGPSLCQMCHYLFGHAIPTLEDFENPKLGISREIEAVLADKSLTQISH